ncbi:MAG: preprotein translocase subunit SecG [Clostridia bacterium]|nr:preprotein translocase subunit SecG [Clostridia bacterium]
MSTLSIVVGILLLVLALFLIVSVLMQQGKSHNLSGTIAGGAETFFGKSKAQSMNKKLSLVTSIVAVVFVVAVLVLTIIQTPNEKMSFWEMLTGGEGEVLEDVADSEADGHEGHDH